MKIAELLIYRKTVVAKVAQLTPIKHFGDNGAFDTKVLRKNISDSVDEVSIQTPRVTLSDLTESYDHFAAELRRIDTAIQKANWETEVAFVETPAPKQKIAEKA